MIKNPHEVIKDLEMRRLPGLSKLALSLITRALKMGSKKVKGGSRRCDSENKMVH